MKKLTDKEWYQKLNQIKEMANKPHEDFEVQIILADLYYTISESYIWDFPKMLWREYQIRKAVKLHKKCCPRLLED